MPVVPKPNDDDVLRWLKLNAPGGSLEYVQYENMGYAARQCHISTKSHAITAGGRRVHGWALWRWPVPDAAIGTTVIYAEHHSVWETPTGKLVDLTPPPGAALSVLFLRDESVPITGSNGVFQMWADRTDKVDCPRVLGGREYPSDNYSLNTNTRPDVRDYADELGFDLARMVTEPDHG